MCNLGPKVRGATVVKIPRKKARYGYRWCRVDWQTGALKSVARFGTPSLWQNRIAESDRPPKLRNKNGLYIFASKDEAGAQNPLGRLYVLCRVRYWGDVVEHERGTRAQFATIIAIAVQVVHTHLGVPIKSLIRSGNPELKITFRSMQKI